MILALAIWLGLAGHAVCLWAFIRYREKRPHIAQRITMANDQGFRLGQLTQMGREIQINQLN